MKFCRNLIEKEPKDRFLRPISSKITLAKKKEKRNRSSEKGEKKKAMVRCTLSFTLSTFGVLAKKLLEGRLSSIWR